MSSVQRKRKICCTFMAVIGLWLCPLHVAGLPLKNHWTLRHWTMAQGLPHLRIHDVAMDAQGYLWCATPSGLARFDGVTWRIYNRNNTPAFTEDRILCLHVAEDGRVLAGTDGGGALIFHQGQWQCIGSEQGLLSGQIRAICSDWSGQIWLGTSYGIYCWSENQLKHYAEKQGLVDGVITGLAMDRQGRIWAAMLSGGLAVFTGDAFEIIPFQGLEDTGILTLTATASGLLAGTFHGAFLMPEGGRRTQPIASLPWSPILALSEHSGGALWAGTPNAGLLYVDAQDRNVDFLPETSVCSLFLQDVDHLWVGTESDGLFLLTRSAIETAGLASGVNGAVTTVIHDRGMRYWAGTRDGSLLYFDGVTLKRKIVLNRTMASVTALAMDDAHALWAGTSTGELYCVQGEAVSHNWGGATLRQHRIQRLLCTDEDTLWIATDHGLFRQSGRQIEPVVPDENIRDLCLDDKGHLILACKAGVARVHKDSLRLIYGHADGGMISVALDGHGRIWCGTRNTGLLCLGHGQARQLRTFDGLPRMPVWSVTLDDDSGLWAATSKGLYCFPGVYAPTEEIQGSVPLWIDASDGLPSSLCGGEGLPDMAVLADGRMAVATAKGIALMNPLTAVAEVVPDPPFVTLGSDKTQALPQDRLSAIPTHEHLTFSLRTPAADYGHRLRYRYKIEGQDSSWKWLSATQAASIVVSALPPGDYRIAAQTVHTSGRHSKTVYRDFIVKGHSVVAVIVILFAACCVVAVFFVIYRKRGAHKKAHPKYQTLALDAQRANTAMVRLEQLMAEECIYLDADLSLKVLAQKCRLHPNHLSRMINETFQMGYNDFINRRRIEHAKALLEEDGSVRSIQQIMEVSGFYSKSVFNTAFKKWNGMTPSQYRKARQLK